MAEGAHASAVGAEERFGAVAGHVDAGGAVGGAGLAGEAQVEGLEDFGRVDGLDELRVRGFLEDAGAPSGHVLLLARGQVGGAHEGAGHSGAAFADARAAVDGGREVAAVVAEGEAAVGGHGTRSNAAQIEIQRIDAGLEFELAASNGERAVGYAGHVGWARGAGGGRIVRCASGTRGTTSAQGRRCIGSAAARGRARSVGPENGTSAEAATGTGSATILRGKSPRRTSPRPGAGGSRGLVHGGGEHPGVEEVSRVENVLDAREQVEHVGGVHEA